MITKCFVDDDVIYTEPELECMSSRSCAEMDTNVLVSPSCLWTRKLVFHQRSSATVISHQIKLSSPSKFLKTVVDLYLHRSICMEI